MKKIVSGTLVALMVASSMVGCTSDQGGEKETASNSSKDTSSSKEPVINAYGWEVPDETLVINVYAGQGSPDSMKEETEALNAYLK